MEKLGLMKIINVVLPQPLPPPNSPSLTPSSVGPWRRQILWPQGTMMLMLCEKATEIGRRAEHHAVF